MNPNLTSGQTRWLSTTAQFAALGAAICYFSFVTADPDLWGHITFGEDLWKAKALVRTDHYSFTAYGHPWINHEWLAELIFYFIYYYLGDAGLLFGKLGVGLAIVLLMGKLCAFRKNDAIIYAMVMITAIIIISPGFMIRPQVFSFLLFTLYLYLLHLYFTQKKKPSFLFAMSDVLLGQLAWGISHGTGPAVYGCPMEECVAPRYKRPGHPAGTVVALVCYDNRCNAIQSIWISVADISLQNPLITPTNRRMAPDTTP